MMADKDPAISKLEGQKMTSRGQAGFPIIPFGEGGFPGRLRSWVVMDIPDSARSFSAAPPEKSCNT